VTNGPVTTIGMWAWIYASLDNWRTCVIVSRRDKRKSKHGGCYRDI